ncbi:MAG TPA: MFS transporter [Candidatus Limnocylindria bacterium]|nr:MFS transporter [Candidatus Limnocylindria bacterium]
MQRRTWTLITVVLGSGIVFLDSTIVNVALRAIGEQLPATVIGRLEGQSYIVNGYLLTLSALLILAGALADRYGRKRLFVIGLAGFGVTSLICGLSPTMEALVVARLAQGSFGAMLVPTALALINAGFEGPARGRAFGVWAAATSALTLLGPPLGGLLVDTFGWRIAFLINVPLVTVGVVVALTRIDESRNPNAPRSFDWLGSVAVAVAVGGLAYGAIRGQQEAWTDPTAWFALALGAVATVALVPLMMYRRDPLMPPSLFASRNFSVTNVSTLLIYGAIYVQGFLSAIFFQQTLGYTALASGLATLPMDVGLIFLSTTFGHLAGKYGPRRFMVAGPLIMGIGLAWYLRIPADSARWAASPQDVATLLPPADYFVDVLPAALVFGLGLSIMVAPLTTALMTSVPVGNSGLASAINNAISRIGPVLAGAVIFIAVSGAFYAGISARVPEVDTTNVAVRDQLPPLNLAEEDDPAGLVQASREASTDAFRLAMLIAALLCLMGAAANLAISDSVARGEEEPLPAGPAEESRPGS